MGYFMSEAAKYQKVQEAKQDLEAAIRKLRAACEEMKVDFTAEMIISVFNATDREVCLQEAREIDG